MKIGIVGGGFVGSATALLKNADVDVIVYDTDPSRCSPAGITRVDLLSCDLVFVCVPTPSYPSGACNTSIVESCITGLKADGIQNIILRSTVPPGTSERLGVSFMPEFLTEANWRTDFVECRQWVFGVTTPRIQAIIEELITLSHRAGVIRYKDMLFVKPEEAELIKYTRNNFLATKIAFFNEIAGLCNAIGVSYDNVRAGVITDPRIGSSHSVVPGPDGKGGFGGTCLPKDTTALLHFMESNGAPSYIVRATVARNTEVDRPEHDWKLNPRTYTACDDKK